MSFFVNLIVKKWTILHYMTIPSTTCADNINLILIELHSILELAVCLLKYVKITKNELHKFQIISYFVSYIIIRELSNNSYEIFNRAIHHLRNIHTSCWALALLIPKKTVLPKVISFLKNQNQIYLFTNCLCLSYSFLLYMFLE